MHYVYLLQSGVDNRRHYTGFTRDLRARLARHNAGQNQSTIHGRPWRLVSYFAFVEETKARECTEWAAQLIADVRNWIKKNCPDLL